MYFTPKNLGTAVNKTKILKEGKEFINNSKGFCDTKNVSVGKQRQIKCHDGLELNVA